MSVEDSADEQELEQEQPANTGGGTGWLWKTLVAVVLLGAGGGAGWYFYLAPAGQAGDETADVVSHEEPIYFTLADNLVVNFHSAGGTRYLQVGIDLMTYDADAIQALEQHTPVLRSNLILLLSDQSQDELMTREGKEALRDAALAEVRKVMTELHGKPVVESLYFTSFVMQ